MAQDRSYYTLKAVARSLLLLAALMLMPVHQAFAEDPIAAPAPAAAPTNATPITATTESKPEKSQCTSFNERISEIFSESSGPSEFGQISGTTQTGILSQIYEFITSIVNEATQKIFENFTQNEAYQNAVYGAVVLSITLFGVFFMIGLVQLTAGQVLVRLIKIGLIFTVISPTGWEFFSEYMVAFFNDGTDELVIGVLQIASGGGELPPDATPFYQLDKLGEFLIDPETFMAIFGTFTAGPFGLGMGALLGLAFAAFIKMLIEALRLYAVTFVVRSLLLGLAPIFIVFLLFEKTKQLFTSWLNAIISTALQPILLFTFLAFFTVMMQSATQNMFSVELCYIEGSGLEGTSNEVSGWHFRDPNPPYNVITEDLTWEGATSCLLRDTGVDNGEDCPEFPIKIVDVLTFLMLVFLCSRFAEVVDRVSNELAGTFISLDPAGKFDQILSQIGQGGQSQPAAGKK